MAIGIMTQDIKTAIRPVFFENTEEEWLYSTHGGTMFIINFRGGCYGLTAKHVFQDFDMSRLVVTRDWIPQKNSPPAHIEKFALFTDDSEIADLCVIFFKDEIDSNFFRGTAYPINENTAGSSEPAH